MLDAVLDYLPAPTDVPAIKGTLPDSEEEVTRESSDDAPFSALAFKVMTDPYVGKWIRPTRSRLPFVEFLTYEPESSVPEYTRKNVNLPT